MLELDLNKEKLVSSPTLTHLERRVQTSDPEVKLFLCLVDQTVVLYSSVAYVGHAKRTHANTHRSTPQTNYLLSTLSFYLSARFGTQKSMRLFSLAPVPEHLTHGFQSDVFLPRRTSPVGDIQCGDTKANSREWVFSTAATGPHPFGANCFMALGLISSFMKQGDLIKNMSSTLRA